MVQTAGVVPSTTRARVYGRLPNIVRRAEEEGRVKEIKPSKRAGKKLTDCSWVATNEDELERMILTGLHGIAFYIRCHWSWCCRELQVLPA